MMFAIFTTGLLFALWNGDYVSFWTFALIACISWMLAIPKVAGRMFHLGTSFRRNNDTRLRVWWLANILLILALIVCTFQALGQVGGGCIPEKNFGGDTALRDRFVAKGHILCERKVSHQWFSPKTLLIFWGTLVVSVFGGIIYVPIAFSDELARANARRRERRAGRASQPGQPIATTAPANGRAFTQRRFFEGLAAAGIMDVIVGAILHRQIGDGS